MFELWLLVGAGRSPSTLRANGVIGTGVPAGYTSPVNGLRTGKVNRPWRWATVGIVELDGTPRVWRKPS